MKARSLNQAKSPFENFMHVGRMSPQHIKRMKSSVLHSGDSAAAKDLLFEALKYEDVELATWIMTNARKKPIKIEKNYKLLP